MGIDEPPMETTMPRFLRALPIALAAVLGQIGLPGGGFAFGHGSINGAATPRPDVAAPRLSAG